MPFADGTAEARVAARYADFDPAEMHRVQVEKNRETERKFQAIVEPLRTASPKSVDYLVDLSRIRFPKVTEASIREWAKTVHYSEVSEKINWLRTLWNKPVAKAPEVPAGRYAVTGNEGHTVFVKVDRPTEGSYAGRTFVKIQASDELHPVRDDRTRDALLRKILADGVEAASKRYGHELNHCGVCGRTLTDADSRTAGIGPKCAAKMGW